MAKPSTPQNISTTHQGSRYRKMWQAVADGVFPQERIPVSSAGARFFNQDNWTARAFVVAMCEDLKRGVVAEGSFPEEHQISAWCRKANERQVYNPSIVVAATAEELSRRDRDAIAGGCYHEKGHTAYSCRRYLTTAEMTTLLEEVWTLVPNWAPYAGTILQWGNLIEDIRIERLLQKDYAGTGKRLAPLQDFVLEQEIEGKAAAEHRGLPVNEDLRVVTGAFRDLGLGYDTPLQMQVLAEYEEASPEAWDLVNTGELSDLLRAAIALGDMNKPGDDLAHLTLAMKVIATLLAKSDSPMDEDNDGEGEGDGENEKVACPKCDAPASKLRSRAVKGQPDKIAIVCTVCGHKHIIDKPEPSTGEGESGDGGGGIAIEDPNAEAQEGGDTAPEGSDVIRADGGEEEGEETASGDSEESESGEGEAGNDSGEGSDSTEGEDSDNTDAQDEGGDGAGSGAGAEQDAMTAEEVAASIMDAIEDGEESGIKTHNEALDALVEAENQKQAENVLPGEKRWNPWNPDGDVVANAQEGSRSAATSLRNKARKNGASLKTMLRRKFLADRSSRRFHGVKRGKGLSDRRLVDSAVEMAANVTPTRPDYTDMAKRDCSLAAAIIVDQSGSMHSRRKEAAIAMLALADGLDGVGAPVLCAGFRDIWGSHGYDTPDTPTMTRNDVNHFHRNGPIGIDVFKGWEEPLRNCIVRFPSVMATGGTPMADGVQFGMQALSDRPERHRVLFVLTDGEPDWEHRGVMRRQIRLAREAGIEVVGIGIDSGCYGVTQTFDVGVAVENLDDLPKSILTILDEIVFPSKAKRVKLDGKFSKKRRRTA